MVTIAILAVVTTVAAPSMQTFVSRSLMRGISADFTLAMQSARSEAISTNQCVAICMSSTGTRCVNSGDNWGVGWIVIRLPACGTVGTATQTAANILLVREGFNTRYQLNPQSAERSVVFNARGVSTLSRAGFNLVDTGVSSSDSINRTFCLDMTGRLSTLKHASTCP